MSSFDFIWIGVCVVYLFQVKQGKGFMYDWIKGRASKRDDFNEETFQKSQYKQVAFFVVVLILLRLFKIYRGVKHL